MGVPEVTRMKQGPLIGVQACVFDAYGTLFDFAAAARGCRDVLGDSIDKLSALWRDKQLQYTWLRAVQGRHADFWQVTGDALDFALQTLAIEQPGLRDRLMNLYLTLDAFPEVPDVLTRLKQAGLRTAILSNGSPNMLHAALHAARLEPLPRCGALGRGGRRLQTAPQGLSTRRRPARRAGCRHRVPIVECVGRLRRLGIRDAGRMVQSLRATAGAIAGRARPNGEIAGRTAGPGRSIIDMNVGAIRGVAMCSSRREARNHQVGTSTKRRNTMNRRAALAMTAVSPRFGRIAVPAGAGISYAQQRSDSDNVNAAVNAFHAALSNLDIGKMQNVWAQEPYVVLINPRDKAPAIGWDAVKKDWQDGVFGFWAELKLSPKPAAHIHVDQTTAWTTGVVGVEGKNKSGQALSFTITETQVYEKRGDRWLMVSHHASRVPE